MSDWTIFWQALSFVLAVLLVWVFLALLAAAAHHEAHTNLERQRQQDTERLLDELITDINNHDK